MPEDQGADSKYRRQATSSLYVTHVGNRCILTRARALKSYLFFRKQRRMCSSKMRAWPKQEEDVECRKQRLPSRRGHRVIQDGGQATQKGNRFSLERRTVCLTKKAQEDT